MFFSSLFVSGRSLELLLYDELCFFFLLKSDPFYKDVNDNPICKTEKETQMYRTVFRTLWEKVRVGCFKRTASKHVYYLG